MKMTFQFTVSGHYNFVPEAIRHAIYSCAENLGEFAGGEFNYKVNAGTGGRGVKFTLFLSRAGDLHTIRIVSEFFASAQDIFAAHDVFLEALQAAGLDIPIAPGSPYIVTSILIGGGVEQQSQQSFSASGAFVGAAVFGDIGALIGGLGNSRTRTKTVFSNSALFILCYSNGLIEERELKKNSRLYDEAMGKLNAEPVIHKDGPQRAYTRPYKPDTKQALPRWMTITIYVILAICLFRLILSIFSLAISGTSSNRSSGSSGATTAATTGAIGSASATSAAQTQDGDHVIVDNEIVKITFERIVDFSDIGVFYLWFNFENKTDYTISAMITEADVDGCTLQSVLGGVSDVRPGNSARSGFIFSMAYLDIDSVKDASTATVKFKVYAEGEWDAIYESNLIAVDLKSLAVEDII